MGWANCGEDSRGRPIGYGFRGRCDEPGCHKRIDRGLGYACGGMHGTASSYCEGYFCGEHLFVVDVDADEPDPPHVGQLCRRCARRYELERRPRDARGRFVSDVEWAKRKDGAK